jgi:hypothetical protein
VAKYKPAKASGAGGVEADHQGGARGQAAAVAPARGRGFEIDDVRAEHERAAARGGPAGHLQEQGAGAVFGRMHRQRERSGRHGAVLRRRRIEEGKFQRGQLFQGVRTRNDDLLEDLGAAFGGRIGHVADLAGFVGLEQIGVAIRRRQRGGNVARTLQAQGHGDRLADLSSRGRRPWRTRLPDGAGKAAGCFGGMGDDQLGTARQVTGVADGPPNGSKNRTDRAAAGVGWIYHADAQGGRTSNAPASARAPWP